MQSHPVYQQAKNKSLFDVETRSMHQLASTSLKELLTSLQSGFQSTPKKNFLGGFFGIKTVPNSLCETGFTFSGGDSQRLFFFRGVGGAGCCFFSPLWVKEEEAGREGGREGALCMTIPTSVRRFVLCHIGGCLCGGALSW